MKTTKDKQYQVPRLLKTTKYKITGENRTATEKMNVGDFRIVTPGVGGYSTLWVVSEENVFVSLALPWVKLKSTVN